MEEEVLINFVNNSTIYLLLGAVNQQVMPLILNDTEKRLY